MTFEKAIKFARKKIREDEELRVGYQSSIAMRLFDTTKLSQPNCNIAADEIMDLLFLKD